MHTQSKNKSYASILYARWQASADLPWLVKLLLKWKIVHNRRQANSLLLTLMIIFFGLSIYFFIFNTSLKINVSTHTVPLAYPSNQR